MNEIQSDIEKHDLPKDGILYFFYDQEGFSWGNKDEGGSWKVIYNKKNSNELIQAEKPPNLPDVSIFEESKICFTTKFSYPPWESDLVQGHSLSDSAIDNYIDFIYKNDTDATITKLLGYPDQIQGDIQVEVQLESSGLTYKDIQVMSDDQREQFKRNKEDWVLLLQLDSEYERNKMMWGDCGRLYFWIKKSDLQDQNFDNVWMILQCY